MLSELILIKKNDFSFILAGNYLNTERLEQLINLKFSEKSINVLREQLRKIKAESRLREKLFSWLVLHALLGATNNADLIIKYDNNGKPTAVFEGKKINISLSHKKELLAVISSNNKTVATDIEMISEKILRIKQKFANKKELFFAENLKEENRKEILTKIWSAKETLFKLWEKGNLDFRENLNVCIDSQGTVGNINFNEKNIEVKIKQKEIEAENRKFILSWALNSN